MNSSNSLMHFPLNMLIKEIAAAERLLRVVGNEGPLGCVWLFAVFDRKWPFPIEWSKAIDGLTGHEPSYRIECEDPWSVSIFGVDSRTATDEAQTRRWGIVRPLVEEDDGLGMLDRKLRSKKIESASKEMNVPRSTIENLLMRYWQRGMTSRALRPDYANSGGRGKTRNSRPGVKIGRPRSISTGTGASIDDTMRGHLTIAAGFYLSSKKKMTQERALNQVVKLFYSTIGTLPDEERELLDARPTERQFQFFMDKNYSHSDRFRRRNGQKKFDLTVRGLGGSGDQNTHGPGDMFQIDATIADVYLVSKLDRNRIVGRPTVYFVIDVWSRLITGLYVGFEGPSWVGAMMALVNMVTPKAGFCAQYDVSIEEDDWPAHHAPKHIMADKGEMASCGLSERIVNALRIRIAHPSTGRADLKSIVERRFGIVQAKFRSFAPGYVEKDYGERGARDPRLDAKLTLREFTTIMIHAVLDHNEGRITNIKTPAPMTTAGKQASAIERWRWGIQNRSGSLRKLEVNEVALNVMPRDKARVTESGIRFKGGFYTCNTARKEGWFSRARLKGTWTKDICFDPRSLQILYLLDSGLPGGFEACELMKPSEELVDVSLFEYEEADHAAKVVKSEGDERRQKQSISTDEKIEKVVKAAAKKAAAARDLGLPKSRRVADIGDNKHAEKALERRTETFDLSPEQKPPPLAPESDDPAASEGRDNYALNFLSKLKLTSKADGNEG